MSEWRPYWVLPQDGDPLPQIGSGFRRIWALEPKTERGRVIRLKLTLDQTEAWHIRRHVWDQVPKVLDTYQPLWQILRDLRAYGHKPTQHKEPKTCPIPPKTSY